MPANKIPFKLHCTRVWRTYTGGKLLAKWQGKVDGTDGEYPEDWIASVTSASYGRDGQKAGQDGLSVIRTGNHSGMLLREVIDSQPKEYLGAEHYERYGNHTALLAKIIDSAERLTIQVHPNQKTAKKLFRSPYGKTESWYILGCREINGERPYVLLGFKEGITREKWKHLFDMQDTAGMMNALHRIEVKPGQVFLIEGGTPHAIGPGCLLMEIQEPTDLTLRVEKTSPAGRIIPDRLCHLGLGFEKMLDCFHYRSYAVDELLEKYLMKPILSFDANGITEKVLIGYEDTPCFKMTLTEIADAADVRPQNTFYTMVVAAGAGTLHCNGEELPIAQGEQLFIPSGSEYRIKRKPADIGEGTLNIIKCFPPEGRTIADAKQI